MSGVAFDEAHEVVGERHGEEKVVLRKIIEDALRGELNRPGVR
eukprot:CAMPEP_0198654042 /NCGR_PEP_ID=MMETSP1467-20131203/7447_1 /TAXON_ID=1462469 /ORGANISM="unid. sp., Strain CCMP2135" /LENGTH=42 /DNA_ID= /DNA_START= /DNA_END= /DNA_ORIENTATION=